MPELETWQALDSHLAYVVQHGKVESLGNVWHYEEEPMTLGFLSEDYVAYTRHHLKQLPNYLSQTRGCPAEAGHLQ